MSIAMTEQRTENDAALWEEMVPGGGHWSAVLRRGTLLRVTDLQGGANVAMTFFNQDEKLERYNMADTLKAQHTACLTTGNVCYSDMGRILCSFTADTCGWHDPIGGIADAKAVMRKYGVARFQEHRNGMYRNARDGLLVELGKYGLSRRDLTTTVNLFSKITVDASGKMVFHPNNSTAGDYVDLRFEMNTLVALSTCQHPLDPNPDYAPKRIRLTALPAAPVAADDACRIQCPENGRGFENTERLFR